MKKVVSLALFFALLLGVCFSFLEANQKSMQELNLSQLVMINQASAEVDPDGEVEDENECEWTLTIGCCGVGYETQIKGKRTECIKGAGSCWTTGLCF